MVFRAFNHMIKIGKKKVFSFLFQFNNISFGRLKSADALVFEVQPFASYANEFVRKPPEFPQKYPDQIFVNNGYEQPHYFHLYAHPGYLVKKKKTSYLLESLLKGVVIRSIMKSI